ncbi:MAG: N-acetylmuramic acid 6-phosphate etherase [Fimbriimonadaceae bacterium]|nr:N-acetylmuramic acid 6-phosphate etherase [Fimbriimonadaceae bacterium]QYK55465.1 MAG: N-acetylmuramic acid 6-phosphate etherase [Fimbriimonadaceae bacterium]
MGTESRNPRSIGLDKMSAREIVRLMNEEEVAAHRAVSTAEAEVAAAIERAAEAYQAGGRIIYVGAGTSGRVAQMDVAEMVPTFGLEPGRFVAVVPDGPADASEEDEPEDSESAAILSLNKLELSLADIVVAIGASGRTPFVVGAARHAGQKGVWTCGICNNRGAPLLQAVDLPILIDTGPEVLTGSTRLKAATAQKLVLNQISTGAMVLSGKVVENLMVDVRAGNSKLRERAVLILRDLTTLHEDEAERLLDAHNWNVRHVLSIVRASEASPVPSTAL